MPTQLLGLPTLPQDLRFTTSSTRKAHFLAFLAHLVQWDWFWFFDVNIERTFLEDPSLLRVGNR